MQFSMCALAAICFAAAAYSQAPAAGPYQLVQIDKFTVAEGVDFPANDLEELNTYLVLQFNKSKRFESVFLTSDAAAQTAAPRRARISGQVTKYSKGSRAARYIVGLGAGRTKLVAEVKVTDAETGALLFEQKVDGHVYGGLFGGETDAAKGNLASEIIKTMTKKGYANAKRLK
jgi:hypothetical protein